MVRLAHRMVDLDEQLIAHASGAYLVLFVYRLGRKRGKRYPVTAYVGFSHCVYGVVADGADVKAGAQHVCADVREPYVNLPQLLRRPKSPRAPQRAPDPGDRRRHQTLNLQWIF